MTTTNVELIKMADHYKVHLHDVLMKDETNDIIPEVGNYIINLQSSDQGGGTHWCAIMCDKTECYYFDSFATAPPKEIDIFLRKKYPKYAYNTKDVQALKSTYCGFFCLALFIYVKNNFIGSFYETCNSYSNMFEINRQLNDVIIRKYFRAILPKSPIAIRILHI